MNGIDQLAMSRLAAIVDSSYDAIISKDMDSIIQTWNPAAERLFGYTADEAVGQSVLILIPEHLQQEEVDIINRIKRGEAVPSYETIRRRKDGSLVPISLTVSPISDEHGKIVGASKIARDITAARESERRIRLLMREVNHRVKNQFAVILSMIRETTRRASHPEGVEAQIRERIMALSRSHDLLVHSNWSGTGLSELLMEHLRPFGGDHAEISGPDVTLHAGAVQHLGIAFHELATNSAKYGALSNGGHLSVMWFIELGEAGQSRLKLMWSETVSPQADEESASGKRAGFGTVVLQRITPQALGGSADLQRGEGLLRWSIDAPLDAVIVKSAV